MTLQISCPACAASFTTADDLRGKKAFCPRCGQALVVSSAGVAKRNEADFGLPVEGGAVPGAGVTKRTPGQAAAPAALPVAVPAGVQSAVQASPRRKRWPLAVGLLLLLATMGILYWLLVHRSERSHEHAGWPPPDLRPEGPVVEVPERELVVHLPKGVKMEFIRIEAGEFFMGSHESDHDAQNNEKPQHRVRITKDFYLGKYPVTQEQFQAVMGKNPSGFSSQRFPKGARGEATDARHCPVESVSWDAASEFCAALTREDGRRKFRLPTEAQWEYAARAGTGTRYSYGNSSADLPLYAWFKENSDLRTNEVGTRKPNPWGLYDMHGNVRQWCADRMDQFGFGPSSYYAQSPREDPKGPEKGQMRVLRGGSWADPPLVCRSASRAGLDPSSSHYTIGFRVCIRLEARDGDE
jgi:formylglycine-generating enzyme required for sulfatase activity